MKTFALAASVWALALGSHTNAAGLSHRQHEKAEVRVLTSCVAKANAVEKVGDFIVTKPTAAKSPGKQVDASASPTPSKPPRPSTRPAPAL